ncbi:MAG: extracellular solute-binding protein, partial [Chloroflexota bacterium]
MTAVCVRATPTIRHDHRQLSRRCVLAAGPFGALALAACAPPGSSTPPAETGKLGPATLQVLIGGGKDSQALLQDKLLPAFTERHPAVTIEYGPNINLTKKRALFAAGTGPDIFMNGAAQAPAVAEDKLAIPLDDRIKAWGKLSDFFPASLTASQWEGKQWGLPMMVAARTYVWRKNVLTEVGVSQTPVTWDDAAEASRRSTTVQDGQIAREGFNPPESYLLFIQSLLSTGKTLFRNGRAEFIGQEGITALQYLLDLHNAVR